LNAKEASDLLEPPVKSERWLVLQFYSTIFLVREAVLDL
jgi:hypothetical protein